MHIGVCFAPDGDRCAEIADRQFGARSEYSNI
jgi:hypothetical protein